MPQFDKITFFNQTFWLFFFFSGFYLILLKIFLPKLSSVLKARTKKLQKGSEGVASFAQEQNNIIEKFNGSIEHILSVVKTFVVNHSGKIDFWLDVKYFAGNCVKFLRQKRKRERIFHKQITIKLLFIL